jgi:hypothetical protein
MDDQCDLQVSAVGSPRDAPDQSMTRGPAGVSSTLPGWTVAVAEPIAIGQLRKARRGLGRHLGGDTIGSSLEELTDAVLERGHRRRGADLVQTRADDPRRRPPE